MQETEPKRTAYSGSRVLGQRKQMASELPAFKSARILTDYSKLAGPPRERWRKPGCGEQGQMWGQETPLPVGHTYTGACRLLSKCYCRHGHEHEGPEPVMMLANSLCVKIGLFSVPQGCPQGGVICDHLHFMTFLTVLVYPVTVVHTASR